MALAVRKDVLALVAELTNHTGISACGKWVVILSSCQRWPYINRRAVCRETRTGSNSQVLPIASEKLASVSVVVLRTWPAKLTLS